MSARMRIGWGLVAFVGWLGGSPAGADFLSAGGLTANATTGFPSWSNSDSFRSRLALGGISSYHHAPVPTPVVTPIPVAVPVVAAPQVYATAPPPVITAPTPVAAPAPASTVQADAFVNLGTGPYPEAALITSGGAQPWYNSNQIGGLFGGTPTPAQQAAFAGAVMQHVEQTFSLSGVAVALTGDPNVPAAHTLSLVSNTVPTALPTAIGMTDIGANGFSFIDQEAKSATTVDQLAWIVAHNISHELMLAFGVGENYDTTGNYIDARNANLAMMLDPASTFSPAAASALNQALAAAGSTASSTSAAQVVAAQVVPEPGASTLWVVALSVLTATAWRFKSSKKSA